MEGKTDIFAHAHCCIGRPRTLYRLVNKPKTTERKEETLPICFWHSFALYIEDRGIRGQCCGSGSGRIRNFLKDPDPE